MKNKVYILVILFTLISEISFAQTEKVNRRVDKKYNNLSYVETSNSLLKLVEEGNTTPAVYKKLANSYFFNSKMEDAAKWYGALIALDEVIEYEYYYRYAMSLKAIGKYSEADKYMSKFAALKPEDSRAVLFSKSPNYLESIELLSGRFKMKNLDFNSKYSDFGTSFYKKGIVFASSRTEGKLYKWNHQPFLDLYIKMDSSDVVKAIKGDINTKYHESSTTFSSDGTTMYFTRNNYFEGKTRKSSDRVNGLKIFKATLVDSIWTNIVPMPFNSDEYSTAHPALSLNETKLYFSSDMPGTHGKSDIYMVAINQDGTYGEPINMGNIINTEGRENFPYVSNIGSLYFSSDGHPGLGGLDVFHFDEKDTATGRVVNLGKPVNSPLDDFEFILDEFTLEGYLTSNRKDGKGDDDIYKFTRIIYTQIVSGTTVDKKTDVLIPFASIEIYDKDNAIVKSGTSDENGDFSFEMPPEKETYKIIVSKDDYVQDTQQFKINPKRNEEIQLKLNLELSKDAAGIGRDLVEILDLAPIYFNFDKYTIRSDAEIELKKVIAYMQKYPSVRIEVQSHTDSRSVDAYNLVLSNQRNKATRDYIINKGGIAKERLEGQGYGETQLVNRCTNRVKCSEREHQLNRRSMFIVIAH